MMAKFHVEERRVKRWFVGGKGYGSKARAYKEAAKLAIKENVLGPLVTVADEMYGEFTYERREKLLGVDPKDTKDVAFALFAKAFPHDYEDCFTSHGYSEPPPCNNEPDDGMCRRRYRWEVERLASEMQQADALAQTKGEGG